MRIGLIGYGVGGSAFHAPLIAATPGLELAAIVTRNAARSQAAMERFPAAAVVPDVADLWDMGLDAVTITTPNDTHAPLAHTALDHGMNVVVDKPLATKVPDAEQLVAHAERSGLLLTVYLNRRWDGDFLTVKELVAAGTLGEVHRFESRFERWRPAVAQSWKETTPEGGGILFDLGPHVIDQALQLFGPVQTVYAEVGTVRPAGVNPDDVFLALTHRSGVRSHLWLSAAAADQGPRFRLLGSNGAYRVFGMDPQEAALREGRMPVPGSAEWGTSDESDWGTITGGPRPVTYPTHSGAYPQFYTHWAAALHGVGPVPVDPVDAIDALRIIAGAERSAWSTFDEEIVSS